MIFLLSTVPVPVFPYILAVLFSVDSKLQSLLYNQINKDKGVSVAMNPNNGEVLALVSTPAYDLNDFVLGLSNDKWNSLNNDENKPMYNRFQATLVPGSSFKSFTEAVGLDSKKTIQIIRRT